MRMCIIGFPNSGEKTLFQALTGAKISDKDVLSDTIRGIAYVNDYRLDNLVAILNPKNKVKATLEIEIFQKMNEGFSSNPSVAIDIAKNDIILYIVRAFDDDTVYHIKGSVNPQRDIEILNSELILNDLVFIEKRLEKIEKDLKKIKDEKVEEEKNFLLNLKKHLETSNYLSSYVFSPIEKKTISGYPLLTIKKTIVVLNVSEKSIKDTKCLENLQNLYKHFAFVQICVKTESEIASLEEKDREQFLQILDIKEPALNLLTHVCLKELNLISFFTLKHDEVRQWLIRKGSDAVTAAASIHTDMGKGFIRAEVIKYDDIVRLGSDQRVRQEGKMYVKGKQYIVEDADILNIRFSV